MATPATTAPNAAATTTQNQQASDGASQGTFTVPEKFVGKSVEDVARAYVELEKQFGARSDYDQLKQEREALRGKTQTYEQALQAWEPWRAHLEAFGWDPTKLRQAMQASQSAATTQSANVLEQWASKWSEYLTNAQYDQAFPWLLNEVIAPLYRADQQRVLEAISGSLQNAMRGFHNHYSQREKLMFSMLKALMPDKDIQGLYDSAYKRAEERAKEGYDPFLDEMHAQLDQQKRTEWEKEREKQIRADLLREQEERARPSVLGAPRAPAGGTKPKSAEERRLQAVRRIREIAPETSL